MPTYTYRCQECQNNFTVRLSYKDYGEKEIVCPDCQSRHVSRCIERVRIVRSGVSNLSDLSPEQLDSLEDDPRALGRMMRKMSEETGEELGPEFDEVVSRLEKGQDPEQISQEMPEIEDDFGGPSGLED